MHVRGALIQSPEHNLRGGVDRHSQNGVDGSSVVHFQAFSARDLQTSRIQTQLMQHGRMQVGDVVSVFDRMEAEFVGRAVNDSALHAAARPAAHGESIRMVIAAVGILEARRASELGADDDQRFFQQSALLEVSESARQSADRPDHTAWSDCSSVRRAHPMPRAAVAAVEHLHEPHALFHQAPRHQALLAERFASGPDQAVHLPASLPSLPQS